MTEINYHPWLRYIDNKNYPEWLGLTEKECRIKWEEREEKIKKISEDRKRKEIDSAIFQEKYDAFGPKHCDCELSQLMGDDNFHLKVQEFMSSPNRILLYVGNAGVGKTFLCAALF